MANALNIDDLLANLSDADAQKVLDRLEHRLQSAAPLGAVETDTYELLREAVRGNIPPISKFVQVRGIGGNKGFKAKSAKLFAIMNEGYVVPLRKPQRLALAREALSCLAEYLEDIRVPVTAVSLLLNLDSMKAAVNEAYPGYMAAKMLHKIVPIAKAA